ncbi:hypothetical protein SEUCBS139899_005048 [Sporothrix eucalyptigena]|uniref:Phosphatidylethanolamine-binding protein PEBP n=1 Tax=Sporothrix eucalyptigena TaxID=1812306 RepID=A0ABP0BVG3_9PEZI
MVSTITFLAVAASVVSASTPPGFQPAVRTQLVVDYGNTLINGQVVAKNLVTNQPTIGVEQRLSGNSFTVIMIDMDIPADNAGHTTTLLHWMQMGLSVSQQASRVGRFADASDPNAASAPSADSTAPTGLTDPTTAGASSDAAETAFLLRNTTGLAPAAAYISPNPPARLPLSHTYAQFLIDTTGLTQQSNAMQVLMNASQTRQGFNIQQVLQQAGLSNKIVAANFFNVTNPGPVQNTNQQQDGTAGSSSSSAAGNNNSTSESSSSSTTTTTYGSSGTLTDTSSSTTAASGNVVKASAASLSSISGPVATLAGIVVLFFTL